MNSVLADWNAADAETAKEVMLSCCGAQRWAATIVALRPISSVEELSLTADEVWSTMEEADWLEAFSHHPRIGERKAAAATAQSTAWSKQEQSSTENAKAQVMDEIAKENSVYEQRFGFTYIVCATGKSADEMLKILKRRLENDRETELREAAEQQRQIMQIRLGKWLAE